MANRSGIIAVLCCGVVLVGCKMHRVCNTSTAAVMQAGQMLLSGEVVNGVRVIKITAMRFEYDPNTIVVKRGQPVRLEITSMDVTHGFALEGTKIDLKLHPHQMQVAEFTPDKAGKFEYYCTQYCGVGHTRMRGYMYVQE